MTFLGRSAAPRKSPTLQCFTSLDKFERNLSKKRDTSLSASPGRKAVVNEVLERTVIVDSSEVAG